MAESLQEYETAFLVYLRDDGEYVATSNLEPFNIRRNATLRDLQRGMSETLPIVVERMKQIDNAVSQRSDDVAEAMKAALAKKAKG